MNLQLDNNAFANQPHNRPYLPPAQPLNAPDMKIIENNNQIPVNGDNIHQVWSKHSFDVTIDNNFNKNNNTMSWAEIVKSQVEIEPEKPEPAPANAASSDADQDSDGLDKEENCSPSHHARRPMNAFLIFCKKHRPIVRENFPTLENRGVTKILGEWWSLLDDADKKPYTDLAKEYKDRFMSDNPGFKWYKLPAPPLRTLNTRPPVVHKSPPPVVSSPTSPVEAEFTPGKLADESQLGSLTSLLNNCSSGQMMNATITEHQGENNNNMSSNGGDLFDNSLVSPVNLLKCSAVPPKPIKKRPYEHHLVDNKSVSRNILDTDISQNGKLDQNYELGTADVLNMTKQDVVNRSVDSMFTKLPEDSNGFKEVRKSGRSCKGKRYEQFMVEGKLLGNKRETKLTQQRIVEKIIKTDSQLNKADKKPETQTPKVGLESTIKRLAERTNIKIDLDDAKPDEVMENKSNDRLRTISETSEDSFTRNATQTSNFNLDLRISELPCLSYSQFLQRKRESKKRKNNRFKHDSESKRKIQKVSQEAHPIGAKKRKNKQKITHLNNSGENSESILNDLSGLATLAEIAAKTEKLGEQNTSE